MATRRQPSCYIIAHMDRRYAWPILASLLAAAAAVGATLVGVGCRCDGTPGPGPTASASGAALRPELASKVLAKVGDREITLGDYAAALDRMDRFERLRYQTPERRKLLLDEIIHAELLAGEARRRGLDKDPKVQARLRQALRDELLEEIHRGAPGPEDIPDAEVRSYYEKHRGDFFMAERRRLSAIVTRDRETALQALEKARDGDPSTWGELVEKLSVRKSETSDAGLRGDLGFLTKSPSNSDAASGVPDLVRAAGFRIPKVGDVYEQVVEADGEFYVIRLVTKNEAGQRGLKEAERTIRVTLAQRALRAAEKRVEADLRKRYPVEVDEQELSQVRAPTTGSD